MNWGKNFDDDIEFDRKYNVYSSKRIKGYRFDKKEEVKFFHSLIDLSPNTDIQKIIQVMSIVMKLLDVESEWKFNVK